MFAPFFHDDELAAPGPERVRVRWLETAGFALEFQGTTLLFDPYVTPSAACGSDPLTTVITWADAPHCPPRRTAPRRPRL